jgi:hypothetical protein
VTVNVYLPMKHSLARGLTLRALSYYLRCCLHSLSGEGQFKLFCELFFVNHQRYSCRPIRSRARG